MRALQAVRPRSLTRPRAGISVASQIKAVTPKNGDSTAETAVSLWSRFAQGKKSPHLMPSVFRLSMKVEEIDCNDSLVLWDTKSP